MINVVFPAEPGSYNELDQFWKAEAEAAKSVGFGISLVANTHFGGEISVSNQSADRYFYRGWIVKPQTYQEMASKVPLITNHESYLWSFEFPRWYAVLEDYTPFSFIYEADDIVKRGLENLAKNVAEVAETNYLSSMIMKDFLKSRKHEWYDACFINNALDEKEILRIMTNFFNLQGRDFYGGLVFRDFLNLKKLGTHPKSKMPLPVEYRTFFFNQKPFFTVPYWSNDLPYEEKSQPPPQEWLEEFGSKIRVPFCAADIAQDENDKWWGIEINDGGSAGLPSRVSVENFYKLLYQNLQ
jgi:hypothetical protein